MKIEYIESLNSKIGKLTDVEVNKYAIKNVQLILQFTKLYFIIKLIDKSELLF